MLGAQGLEVALQEGRGEPAYVFGADTCDVDAGSPAPFAMLSARGVRVLSFKKSSESVR